MIYLRLGNIFCTFRLHILYLIKPNTYISQCIVALAHISMRCVRHGMRHGCASELELGMGNRPNEELEAWVPRG